jgi:hypothetical protein
MSEKPNGHRDDKHTVIPDIEGAAGQAVLPDFAEDFGYDSAQMEGWDEAFCRLVASGMFAYEALMRAKPGRLRPSSAKVSASRLLDAKVLTNANRLSYIRLLRKRYAQNLDMTTERTLLELRRIAYGNYQDFFDDRGCLIPINQLPPHVTATITGVDRSGKYKTDKTTALLNLAKIQGLLKDSVELTGKNGGPVEHSITGLLSEITGNTRDLVQEPVE